MALWLQGISSTTPEKMEPRNIIGRAPGGCCFAGESRGVTIDYDGVVSGNPAIRPVMVLSLDFCP